MILNPFLRKIFKKKTVPLKCSDYRDTVAVIASWEKFLTAIYEGKTNGYYTEENLTVLLQKSRLDPMSRAYERIQTVIPSVVRETRTG